MGTRRVFVPLLLPLLVSSLASAAPVDHGEAYWRAQIAKVKPGLSEADFAAALHATVDSGISSGQSVTELVRLDDFWVAEVFFDLSGPQLAQTSYRSIGRLERRTRDVWVDPPKDFTGVWTSRFVTGAVSHEITYDHGTYVRFKSFYDNGQLTSDDHYVAGKIDGDAIAYHRDGTKELSGHYSAGKMVGRWLHWSEGGKVEVDETYVDDKLEGLATTYSEDGAKVTFRYHAGAETGQAAWDAKGVLLYAHGTMEAPAPAAAKP